MYKIHSVLGILWLECYLWWGAYRGCTAWFIKAFSFLEVHDPVNTFYSLLFILSVVASKQADLQLLSQKIQVWLFSLI